MLIDSDAPCEEAEKTPSHAAADWVAAVSVRVKEVANVVARSATSFFINTFL